jgi:hypothetical protein
VNIFLKKLVSKYSLLCVKHRTLNESSSQSLGIIETREMRNRSNEEDADRTQVGEAAEIALRLSRSRMKFRTTELFNDRGRKELL